MTTASIKNHLEVDTWRSNGNLSEISGLVIDIYALFLNRDLLALKFHCVKLVVIKGLLATLGAILR